MNKREKAILTRLYWLIAEYKNEHHVLYYSKDVLQSVLRKEYTIAENLVNNKIVGESIIVPPILSQNEEKENNGELIPQELYDKIMEIHESMYDTWC